MGIFGFGSKNGPVVAKLVPAKPTRAPYKRPSRAEMAQRAKDRVEIQKSRALFARMKEEEEYLAALHESDPARFHAIMAKRLGLDVENVANDPLSVTVRTLKELRGAGLLDDPKAAGKDDNVAEIIKAVGQLAPTLFGGRMQPQPQAQPQPQSYVQQVPPQPSPQAQPQSVPAASPEVPGDAMPEDQRAWSSWLIAHLQGKSPRDAATWILNQPQMVDIARGLVATPDHAMFAVMHIAKSQHPEYAAFFDWLDGEHDWVLATAHELRQMVADYQAQQTGQQAERHVNGTASVIAPSMNVGL